MSIETTWGKALAAPFGGYVGALEMHKITGLLLLVLFAILFQQGRWTFRHG